MKKCKLTGEEEGELNLVKEITELKCNGHANHMIQNSLLSRKFVMQQSHLTEQ